MQAVILAAGKGTRMNHLASDLPKVLLEVKNKTLLEYKFDVLPEFIKEIVLVVGYKKDTIIYKYGENYSGKKITYIEDKTLTGTAHALWQTKNVLKNQFLVMMGDDIYSKDSIQKVAENNWGVVCKKVSREEDGSRIILDENGKLTDFVTPKIYREKFNDGGFVFTGLYSLDTDIFKYEPVKMKTKEEWGLPQTLLVAAKNREIKIIEADFWIPISSPEDLEKAKKLI